MILTKRIKASPARSKKQKTQIRLIIPVLFVEILNLDENSQFELTLTENKEIIVKVVEK